MLVEQAPLDLKSREVANLTWFALAKMRRVTRPDKIVRGPCSDGVGGVPGFAMRFAGKSA